MNPAAILPTARGPSAFWLVDPEGAPSNSGAKFHAALDWFAPGGTIVRSPVRGRIVEVKPSRGTSGQIFGGVVKVQESWGSVYVMRHVDPGPFTVGMVARPGDALAKVTNWTDGSDHCHLEVWRTLGGGYRVENMLDPGSLKWGPYSSQPVPPEPAYPPHGNTLRLVLGEREWAGWPECEGPLKWVAAHGVATDQDKAALSWKGDVWRGPKDVTNVARSLVKRFL